MVARLGVLEHRQDVALVKQPGVRVLVTNDQATFIERAINNAEIYEPPVTPIIAEAEEAEAL